MSGWCGVIICTTWRRCCSSRYEAQGPRPKQVDVGAGFSRPLCPPGEHTMTRIAARSAIITIGFALSVALVLGQGQAPPQPAANPQAPPAGAPAGGQGRGGAGAGRGQSTTEPDFT